ncbi:MAG: DNA/RNA non-specific endonuclease [Rhodoferax sp.]
MVLGAFNEAAATPAPIALYAPAQRSSTFDACKHLFPQLTPVPLSSVSAQWQPRALCSDGFAVLYSATSKTPLLVVEMLDGAQLHDTQTRNNAFFADPRLAPGARAELTDYLGSGWDRGHLAAAADRDTAQAMAQSFALSNMVPQDPVNNRKIWSKVEADTRKYVRRTQAQVFVFSGPLFDAGYTTMGDNRVYVPTRLFKLVYDPLAQRAWAHILPNRADARLGPPVDYRRFVAETHWDVLAGQPLR